MEVARVHVRSWQAAYRGLLPKAYLDELRAEDRAARYDFATNDPAKPYTLVGAEGTSISGFATTCPARDADLAKAGELAALYVDPALWGRGFGVLLVVAARTRLVEQGFRRACLWVLEGNTRADRFYRADGWTPDGKRKSDEVWGVAVQEVRYQREL